MLLSPALAAIGAFFALPLAAALVLSLTDFDIYAIADLGNVRFVGLANYTRLLADPLFWTVLRNTLVFVGLGVPLTLAVSLGGALLVDSRRALRPDRRGARRPGPARDRLAGQPALGHGRDHAAVGLALLRLRPGDLRRRP